jgi:hypothetical protein
MGMRLRRLGVPIARISALLLSFGILGSPGPASAASPGAYTGWTQNSASGCFTRAQVPYLDRYLRVVARPQVYCRQEIGLTVRARVRSDRTFSDATVAEWGCKGTTDCVRSFPAGLTTLTVYCGQTRSYVRHGYHSDILVYPGIQAFSWSGSTSSSVTYYSYCGA